MNILIENCTILPMNIQGDDPKYFKGTVGVSGNKISMVSSENNNETHRQRVEHFCNHAGKNMHRIDAQGMLLMPGLINIHNHVSMTLMRGYADDIPLMAWLNDRIWPFEAKLNREDILLGAQLGIAEMLLGGTTCFVDMYWMQEAVAEAVVESGIRAILSPTFFDSKFKDFEKDLQTVVERYKGKYDGRIGTMIAPHSPYSCSPEYLKKAYELAKKYDLAINIHLSETIDEVDIIRQRYNKTPVEHIRDMGLFDSQALAVHTVHLTKSDISILKQHTVSVAHNPQSNMKLASGIAPVAQLLSEGINVGIGTDGPCSNNDLDMWDEMRSASFLQKVYTGDPCVLPAYEVLLMATVNGAKAIGMEGKLGTIEEGMIADMILVDMRKPHLYPIHDIVANMVYCAKNSDVDTVIVNGNIVVESGRCNTMDSGVLCSAIQRKVEEIKSR